MTERKQETLADIVAEMRNTSKIESDNATRLKKTYNDDVDYALANVYNEDARYLAQIADRIEAAWKREAREIEVNAAPLPCVVIRKGNAAAMREALVTIQNCDIGKEEDCITLYRVCNAALAAPPRNCDLPFFVDGPADNNADKAWLVFKKHNTDAYFDVPGLLRCIDWLFATAAEREGEGE